MSSNCLQRRPLLCNESYAGLSKGKPDKASKETEFVDSPGRGNMALAGDLVILRALANLRGRFSNVRRVCQPCEMHSDHDAAAAELC